MNRRKKSLISLSTTQVILLGFLGMILLGSFLLTLPVSSGTSVSYIDALFTATTATCVTGLVTLPTATAWSGFGQAVILVLIQVGGLGVMTVMSGFLLALHRKMGMKERFLLQDAFNLNTLTGLGQFLKKVIVGTLLVEALGTLICMTVFVPEFGAKGIWISVFHSVSAFCNAGMDLIGESSLYAYSAHPLINFVTCALIILGGLGYIVWWDLLRVVKRLGKEGVRCFRRLTLHSKIALSSTAFLLFFGAVFVFVLERNNPATLGNAPLWEQIQMACFQSVTLRTAGFATIPQESLTTACALVSLLLMFIGGSPVGTAGGIKTVTAVVLFCTAASAIGGKPYASLFHRRLSDQAVKKAVAVTGMSFCVVLFSTLFLAACTPAPFLDLLYETVSATATVGLSRALTPSLGLCGKLIIIATMYLGRIGPISLAVAFQTDLNRNNMIEDPTEEISVG